MYAILLVVCYVYTNHACERNGNVVDRGNLEWACIDKKSRTCGCGVGSK